MWFRVMMFMAMASTGDRVCANGLLVPTERGVPPLQLIYQRVNVSIRDRAAMTRVEQEFSNPTSRPLEAWYIFPLPSGAAVRDFAMWVDGKRVSGEMLDAKQAAAIYEDIVRRSRDPGLLEQLGNNLWRVRVFPVPAQGRQKIEITYGEIVPHDADLSQYTFPLKTSSGSTAVRDDFTVRVDIEASAGVKNVYSPSHAVGVTKVSDRKAIAGHESRGVKLDRDFRLYWTTSDREVGLSILPSRESPGDDGYFLMLLSPKFELGQATRQPRDIVFVVDTSGSMQGEKMTQAKKALESCLKSLAPDDRFGLLRFSTTTSAFSSSLETASASREKAVEWVRQLEAVGGTAIDEALQAALAMRPTDARNYSIVFLTDGEPTVGVTEPKKILDNVDARNPAQTRVFCFGVGDDVNAQLLDQLAEKTNATTVYVRPIENLEHKVSSFYAKVSRPVLTKLTLSVANPAVQFIDMFPPKLPDLFHGGQLVVVGRFRGAGATALRLEGEVAGERKTFVFEANLPTERRDADFVPVLWARRKIGYLLDQIRLNGERKELIDETIALSKKHGIATPYTSYLVHPDDAPMPRPIVRGLILRGRAGGAPPPAPSGQKTVLRARATPGSAGGGGFAADDESEVRAEALAGGAIRAPANAAGKDAVDYAIVLGKLKNAQAAGSSVRSAGGKTFILVDGIWIDREVKPNATAIRVQYLSEAYFALVNHHAKTRAILAVGPKVIWLSAAGKTIAIADDGKTTMSAEEARELLGAP